MNKKNYELIEHTADVGIRVQGVSLKELFTNAARSMFDIIAQVKPLKRLDAKRPAKTIAVEQRGGNVEELFVNWLNELLSLSSAKEVIFSEFIIRSISKNDLFAAVSGYASREYKSLKEIKAATYHQLKVARTGKGWKAEVIFDV